MKIVIVDYGMGNIKSIYSAFKYLGVDDIMISNQSHDILSADKLILPGVGSFKKAIKNIKALYIDEYLEEAIQVKKKPILGICLGMQLMGESSNEGDFTTGLGFIPGKVTLLNIGNILKVPHVGFDQVEFSASSRLSKGLPNLSDFYFIHSYKMNCDEDINQALCDYGGSFIASYEKDNIAGVQFHPELSQKNGLKLLQNFMERF